MIDDHPRAPRAALPFAKYHGLGNDFVLVDAAALPCAMTPAWARRLCERHTGIGADGVLVREPARDGDESALCRMVVFNADGSRPQMCGNGLRCFALWLEDQGLSGGARDFVVGTDAGPRPCRIATDASGARSVTIAMGVPRFERSALPMAGSGEAVELVALEGHPAVRVRGVSMGNPHAVVRLDAAGTEAVARVVGPQLMAHALFPERTNVELAYCRPDGSIELTVYERGVGITQACGTGAVATVAALSRDEGARWLEREVAVDLPGGRLSIRLEAANGEAGQSWLSGPALRVFDGLLPAAL